jgi:tetratricopeptide (TPR) repeat protein
MRKILSATCVAALLASGPVLAQAQKTAGDKPTTVIIEGQKKRSPDNPHPWIRGESAHFIVYSDAAPADAQALIARLERFHSLLRHIAGQDTAPDTAGPKLEFYYVAHSDSLAIADPAPPPYAIGLYKSCEEGVQGYGVDMYYRPEAKQALERQPENEGQVYIQEAYARHFLMVNDSHRTPAWFIDGFAHYLATARFDNSQAVLGMAPQAYADYLTAINGEVDYHLDYSDVLADVDHKSGTNAQDTASIRNEFGARAWILTHWIESTQENRAKFSAYLKAIDSGAKPAEALQTAFGLSPSRLDYTMWTYLKSRHVMAMKMAFTVPTPPDVAFETLPPSADKLLMWQSALKGCITPAYGAKLLPQIRDEAAKFPQSDLAQDTLDRAEILWGDPRRVLPALNRASLDEPGDFESQYLLGRAELAVAQASSGDEQAQAFKAAKQAFLRAADIDPNSAPNIYAYFRAQILSYDQPNEAATSAAILAWQLAPEVDTYALAAGLSYAHLGRTDDALHVLHTVADDPHGRSLAGVARTWIARLTPGAQNAATDADITAALKAGVAAPEGGLAQWTLANHDVLKAQLQAVTDELMDELQAGDGGGAPPAD